MLVEQIQDLRAFSKDWYMSVFQHSHEEWHVVLSKDIIDGPMVMGMANNPKAAFRKAFKYAQEYEANLKKSS